MGTGEKNLVTKWKPLLPTPAAYSGEDVQEPVLSSQRTCLASRKRRCTTGCPLTPSSFIYRLCSPERDYVNRQRATRFCHGLLRQFQSLGSAWKTFAMIEILSNEIILKSNLNAKFSNSRISE